MTLTESTDPNAGTKEGKIPGLPATDMTTATEPPENTLIFGSFWIGKAEFALPVSAIREVVNEPDAISAMPLAPPFLLGLFNLRGFVIPIIDLRLLLELPKSDTTEGAQDTRKVAIVENGDRCVGILFDRAGEVLNKPASVRVNFRANDGGVKDTVIDGVLKLEGGARMVQVIDPYEVLRIDRVPQTDASDSQSRQSSKLGKRLSCVSFQMGHTSCAMDLRYVQEVTEMPPVDTSLLKYGYVIGTANLRGETIPIVDFRSFIGPEPVFDLGEVVLAERKLLVIQTDGGLLGLMVYSIDSIIPFFKSDVLPFAKLALPRGDIVKGCLVGENDELVMLLDHAKLGSDPGLVEPARTCREVHKNVGKDVEQTATSRLQERRTFIVFSIDRSFAMDTRQVSEVINRPATMSEPPFALDYVEGIINLRGELITLVNLRRLYGVDVCEEAEQKVVIFTDDVQKFAILVDSVDEMVTTTADKITTNNWKANTEATEGTTEDVSGFLECTRADGGAHLIMIMDGSALIQRCARIGH